jgi:hypothetical protein
LTGGVLTGGPELAVFSGRGAGLVEDSVTLDNGGVFPWTTSVGNVFHRGLAPVRNIRLELWEGVAGDLSALVRDDVRYAAEALRLSRMGVRLDYGQVRELEPEPGLTEVKFKEADCFSAPYLNQFVEPDMDPAEKVIHVLYVKEILGSGAVGTTCWDWGYMDYGLILIKYGAPWSTLLHELGHFLGQNNYNYDLGHTYTYLGFNCTNAMHEGGTTSCPGNRNRFTLGQVFRTWVDPSENWLDHTSPLPFTRQCPKDQVEEMGVCPKLSLDVKGTEGVP